MQTTKLAALTLAGLMSASAFAGTTDNGAMHDKDAYDSKSSAMKSGTHDGKMDGAHDDTMMDGKTTDDTDRTGLTTGAGTTVDGETAGPGTETGTSVGNTTATGNSATGN
ncbi:MAG TPA: hypothetical protein DCR78_16755 [Pseudomonas sp.]|jgi:hypothetical protein|uniref:hypothetical protein n=1 Tax=Stutzerimonas xanthomarina TaxID=271420 RepID=UPI000E9913B0|nr:hypothetical protein [Stutzerimonas xanthomarina]MBU0811318.1 hypothetical protein [Gammaproteobacteria bacterium]HAQ88073.1 hypothetical protein [Pseudomonas sp.]MBK3844857.1 hypothetical protein [Stutzerimonas xanthomarina]MBU0852779.1 hypothetical protein [Gammaproteobacteria bacterium]MBU1303012.1 hypothetical protein [Gammaproteobacteria bacterium]|tara:strand:- start:264 stop:593 length:330 start_codon:yes stop_codon:yes gene_type:complete